MNRALNVLLNHRVFPSPDYNISALRYSLSFTLRCHMMESTATSFRWRRLQEQNVSSEPDKSAASREPHRRLSLTLFFFSAAASTMGFFPEDCLQEDVLASNFLSSAGWCTAYVPRSLHWGRGPGTMPAFLKRSQRLAVGIISVARFLCSRKAQKLSKEARLSVIL